STGLPVKELLPQPESLLDHTAQVMLSKPSITHKPAACIIKCGLLAVIAIQSGISSLPSRSFNA
ncbi:hypothetical protein, partial [Pseudomonas viridiflava]|uniref:hypothetical protein n=1 Tax=Pseudomonas viridiflava TaxID=33069 RepID=UPI00197F1C2E